MSFIIIQSDEREASLEEIDNYQKKTKVEIVEEQKKKLYAIENPKWQSQIRIDMTTLRNFESKNNCFLFNINLTVLLRLALLNENELLIDVIKRPCLR